ncbi:hypothetical protein DWZ84_13795 [Coprobacillus sp. AF35-8]|nr:hypothetical protein DWZ84_13795 [Coprobacillus sp. AF35-8]
MNEIKKVEYQENAVFGNPKASQDGLISITQKLLNANIENGYPEVILKAITGAGKTIIMCKYIEEIYKLDYDDPIVFIWLSIGAGGLHFQSADKIRPYLLPNGINVICPENEKDYNTHCFHNKDVLVLNWEKINNMNEDRTELISNLLVGEKHNIRSTIKNSPSNTKYIVLVDEFHKNYDTPAYNAIMQIFSPKMILGMTATPTKEQLANAYDKIIIPTSQVRKSGMIKKGILFNDDVDVSKVNNDTNIGLIETLLQSATEKRMNLEKQYKEMDNNTIPLCLIQLPNGNVNTDIKNIVDSYLHSAIDNGQMLREGIDYIYWLSNDITNKELLETINENDVRYLVFKQAVATGWDCPRAQVLVKLRNKSQTSDTFDLQTIGRILRMPERYFYDNDDLNYSYIYALDETVKYDAEAVSSFDGVMPNVEIKSNKFINDTKLFEYVLETARYKYSEPLYEFKDLMKDIFDANLTMKNEDLKSIQSQLIETHVNTDQLEKTIDLTEDDKKTIVYNYTQLNREYEHLINVDLSTPYASTTDMRILINGYFSHYLEDIDKNDKVKYYEALYKSILLNKTDIINCVKMMNQKMSSSRKRIFEKDEEIYRFPVNIKYNTDDTENKKYKKYLYLPCTATDKSFSVPETIFIEHIEKLNSVKWWFKFPDKGPDALCINYSHGNEGNYENKPTFPDFIVCFENNGELNIGIYETKDSLDTDPTVNEKQIAIDEYKNRLRRKISQLKKEQDIVVSNLDAEVYGGVIRIKVINRNSAIGVIEENTRSKHDELE